MNRHLTKTPATWLTAAEVQAVTGWDTHFIAIARISRLLKAKRERRSETRYLLSSIEELKAKLEAL